MMKKNCKTLDKEAFLLYLCQWKFPIQYPLRTDVLKTNFIHYYIAMKNKKKYKKKSAKIESDLQGSKKKDIFANLTPQMVDTIITERGLVFIDPLSDFGFKRQLGTERNKEFTIHLLNTFIGDDIGTITGITFIASEQVGFFPGKKKVRLDIHCKTQKHDHVIIEMQRERQMFFVRRLRVYSGHSTVNSVGSGDNVYATVPKVYSLSFMEKAMPEFEGRERFFWKVYQKDDDNEIFSKENVLYFVELCKFAAQLDALDLTDEKNLWLYMLTHVADVTEEFLLQANPIFRRFYHDCLVSNLNDMEKKEYVASVLEYDDVKESLMCEREVGREEGREEGRVERTRQLAVNMLSEGLAPKMVARISGLTEDEVLCLIR